ncbi:progonadoliberin-1 [Protobothrops mucrosquamatus]|uniref:progonadoliberin-1 n=1 Tax=Protobothrops mucrosquamatus TaxID=103944 RepID=UPI0007756882|nr:progonadoliberin-1 [Protobothrops mucrosquamatus]
MQKTRMLISSFFLLLISLSTCFAQHWSYGFQPGGKRDVENLRDSFQEIENEVDKAGEMQPFECNVPRQHFTLRGLKSASLTEGEKGQKKIQSYPNQNEK